MIAYGYAAYLALGFASNVAVRYHATLNLVVVLIVVGATFAVMTFIALRLTGRLARPWFAVLGALTYPLYLVHDRAGVVLFTRLGSVVNRWALLGFVMAFMFGLARATHRYVERPFAPVLKRVVTRVLGPAMDGPQNPALPQDSGESNAEMTTHSRDLANADSNLPRPVRYGLSRS
jgi:peptidoglycan/LPS O-acetylase OafA/YrhL